MKSINKFLFYQKDRKKSMLTLLVSKHHNSILLASTSWMDIWADRHHIHLGDEISFSLLSIHRQVWSDCVRALVYEFLIPKEEKNRGDKSTNCEGKKCMYMSVNMCIAIGILISTTDRRKG
jgi:hypothetical protein